MAVRPGHRSEQRELHRIAGTITGRADVRPLRPITLTAAFLVLLIVLRPPEIHPESRIALALLVPLGLVAAIRSLPLALAAARAAALVLAGAGVFLVFNAATALQTDGALAAIERLSLAVAVFLIFEGLGSGTGRRIGLTAGVLAAAGTAAALIAIWQAAYGFEALAAGIRDTAASLPEETRAAMLARIEGGRVFGPLLLPASLAGLLAMTLPCTLACAQGLRGAGRAALLAGALAQGAALAATASIGGIASLTLAAAATGVATKKSATSRLRHAFVMLLAGGLVIGAAAWSRGVGRSPVQLAPGSIGSSGTVAAAVAPDDPAGLRRGNWNAASGMIALHPVLGAGGGGYGALYPLLRREGMNESRHAHNSYLELVVEYGLGALPAIVLLVACCLGRWRRACAQGGAAAIAATGILAFLVHNAVDFTAYQAGVLVPFVVLLAGLGSLRAAHAETPPGAANSSEVMAAPHRAASVIAWGIGLAVALHAAGGGFADLSRERARELVASGDLPGALLEYAAAAAWNPLDPAPRGEAAQVLLQAGRAGQGDDADFDARAAVNLDPVSAARSLLLGRTLLRAGRPAEAFVCFARSERLYPMDGEARAERERLEGELKAPLTLPEGAAR